LPAEQAGVGALAVGRLRRGERVLPAEAVPVIDVEAERDDVASARQFAEQRIGRRAGGASLRGEQFDDGRARFRLGERCAQQQSNPQ